MKLSPLQLEYYFVAESHVTTIRQFDPEKPADVQAQDISVVTDIKPMGEERRWEVTLRVQFTPGPEVNTPYVFTVDLVGFFTARPDYPAERVERLVQTNGPTILFGIARGVVRDLTGRGPHPPMILPTASFVPDRPAVEVGDVPAAENEPERTPEITSEPTMPMP